MLFRLGLYWTLLAVVVALALWRGDREVRGVALICLLATIGSLHMVRGPWLPGVPFHLLVAIIDVVTLAAFVAIALVSNRYWPLWVAGLQLTTTLSHLLRMMAPDLIQVAYESAMKLWSYPLLIVVGLAAWRQPALDRSTDRDLSP